MRNFINYYLHKLPYLPGQMRPKSNRSSHAQLIKFSSGLNAFTRRSAMGGPFKNSINAPNDFMQKFGPGIKTTAKKVEEPECQTSKTMRTRR